ncbi:MAG: hypothetical protein V4555_07390 [Acidobacteriota bacterium]
MPAAQNGPPPSLRAILNPWTSKSPPPRPKTSLSVTVWLRNQGFSQAQSIAGGIDAWSRQVDPAIARY